MQPDDWVRLGARVRETREARGLKQRQVAREIDMTEKQYAMLERGEITDRGPGLGFLEAVSRAIRLPLAEMLRAAGIPEFSQDPDEFRGLWRKLTATQRAVIVQLMHVMAEEAPQPLDEREVQQEA